MVNHSLTLRVVSYCNKWWLIATSGCEPRKVTKTPRGSVFESWYMYWFLDLYFLLIAIFECVKPKLWLFNANMITWIFALELSTRDNVCLKQKILIIEWKMELKPPPSLLVFIMLSEEIFSRCVMSKDANKGRSSIRQRYKFINFAFLLNIENCSWLIKKICETLGFLKEYLSLPHLPHRDKIFYQSKPILDRLKKWYSTGRRVIILL